MRTLSIDISRALSIDGWMTASELEWLAAQAVQYNLIVEVGSYLGRSTRAILDHTCGVVYALDDWLGPRDVYLDKSERKKIYDRFCSNLSDHISSGKLHIIQADHADLSLIDPITPDMVFIDGSHEYQDVKRDINNWLQRLTSRGLICGHDADHYSVVDAVTETLGEVEVADNTAIWYTRK